MAYLPGQQYVQNASGVWTPVGYASGATSMPVAQRDLNTSRSALIGTFQALNMAPLIGLVNSTFYTTTSITDNYTTANTGSATTTVTANDGFGVLATGTTNPSTAQISSKDFATYNGIGELMFLNGLRAPQAGVTGVIKRWGAYDSVNGYFFEDNAGTFRVVSRKNSVDTAVASGSFNGLIATTYTLDQNSHFFQILMTGGRAVFMIDQVVLHTLTTPAAQTTTSGTLNLSIRVEIISTQTVNQTLEIRGQNIGRLGTVDSKRLNEGLLDAADSELVRAVITASTGTANTYVNQTATAAGTKNALDVNLASSASGITVTPTPAGGQFAAATINSSVVWAVGSAGNATLQMTGGSFTSLPVIFEASLDNQTTWNPIDGTATDSSSSPSSLALTGAATRAWNIPIPGYTHIRVRLYAAGTVTTQPTWTLNQGSFLYDPSPLVAPVDGQKASFSSPLNSTLVASAVTLSDFWTLENAGTRTVRIIRLYFQISLATAGPAGQIQLTKRNVVNTAGTSVTQPIAQHDSSDIASSVVSRLYTAAPTGLGATLNVVRAKRFYGVATTLATMPGDVEWTFGNRPAKGLVLRPGQAIGLNPLAAFGTAPTLSGDVEWTEE